MNALELHQEQTKTFIDQSAVDLVFFRGVQKDDGAGGSINRTPQPQPIQHCRVVGVRTPTVRTIQDGRQVVVTKSVVGMADMDVQVDDTFNWDGRQYRVVNVSNDPVWRRIAEATVID